MSSANPFKFQTANIIDKSEDNREVYANERPIAGINMPMDENIVKFSTTITDDVPFKATRSESMVVQSSLLLDMCADTQAKKQTKILSRVKSVKNNITKLFKRTGRVSPAVSSLGSFSTSRVRQHGVRDIHPSPSLTPMSCVVEVLDTLPSGQTRFKAIASLFAYSEHIVEEHVDDFFTVLGRVAEAPSPLSLMQLLALPESQCTPPTILLNELPTIEEEVGNPDVDAEGVYMEPKMLTSFSSCGPLTMSDSEAKYDAMLAAEFATFSFDSNEIQEWSEEVEREKQEKMDAHFARVSEVLTVPVPKLSAYFATPDKDEFIGDPLPVKTETSETNTSSADSSLETSVDAEEHRPQLSPITHPGLRGVRNYENLRVITDCSDSFSDLSCWSFDLDPSDSTAARSKTAPFRRSVRFNDLRKSFLLLESGICHVPNCER